MDWFHVRLDVFGCTQGKPGVDFHKIRSHICSIKLFAKVYVLVYMVESVNNRGRMKKVLS